LVANPAAVAASGSYYLYSKTTSGGCYSTSGSTAVVVTTGLCLSTPSPRTPAPGTPDSGNAGTELNPQGGTAPYNYTNGSGDAKCLAPVGSPAYQYLPASSNLVIVASTGAYSYTAPTMPGNYYFCVKVCDGSTPQNCNVAVYKVNVPGDLPKFGSTPPVQNPLPGGPGGGDAPSELNPGGGTEPYTWSNGANDAKCIAPEGYLPLPASSNLVVTSAGSYSYTAPTTPGNYYFCLKVCDSSTPQNCNVWVQKVTVGSPAAGLVTVKALLQGAVSGTAMTTTLNTNGLIPTTDPYGKGATTTASILTSNGVTDWVLVELRSASVVGTVVENIAALMKNDGSIINPDGSLPLRFTTTSGNFYLSVRHRNHLGVMTAGTITISSASQTIDFTSASTPTYGLNAQVTLGNGMKAMWAGNSKGITLAGTDKVNYVGLGSSLSGIKAAIGSALSVQVTGYLKADLNLDGKASYTGLGSDLTILKATLNPNGGLNTILNQTF
jgi:hypothetical protein